jgi:hypothetical protein
MSPIYACVSVNGLFHSVFPAKILYLFLMSPIVTELAVLS